MQSNGGFMQADWLTQQQRMQGTNPQVLSASRAYHLEPINMLPQPQQGQQPTSMQGPPSGQHSGNMMMSNGMGTPQVYGQMPIWQPQQQQQMQQQLGSMGPQGNNGAAYGNGSIGGVPVPFGNNNSGSTKGTAGVPNTNEGATSDWNQINFQGIFHNAADPQAQHNVFIQDDGKPLLFPPGHLLAQYPPDYQQQMVFYYRMLRLQYPELYQQYVDYYETFYEPLYHPSPPTPEVKGPRGVPQKKGTNPPQQQRPTPQSQPVAPLPQSLQPLPPPAQEPPQKKPDELQRTNSSLSGGLTKQSSMRRQNSMRRAEVNQLKNEGGLKRLPSMRKS